MALCRRRFMISILVIFLCLQITQIHKTRFFRKIEKGHNEIKKGHNGTKEGYNVTEGGYNVTEEGYNITEEGYNVTEEGHNGIKEGYNVTEEGQIEIKKGHNVTKNSYNVTEKSYNVTEKRYKVTKQPLNNQWLTKCVKTLSQQRLKPFHIQRQNYTIGDCVGMCRKCAWGANPRMGEIFPNWTIAGHYALLACKHSKRSPVHAQIGGGNLEALDEVFRIFEKQAQGFVRPPKQAVVIHLRLGDVIEMSRNSVVQMLTKGGTPAHHVHFKTSIKSVYEYLSDLEQANATQVIIVGGSHFKKHYKKSRIYAGCLERALRHSGVNVSMNLDGGDADREFFFMSHATKVIVSTGGYSRLIGKMVKYFGGTIIGRAF